MHLTVYQRWVALYILLPLVAFLPIMALLLSILGTAFYDPNAGKRSGRLTHNPELIFAGDSRSERGLDPATAERVLGWPEGKAANIAVAAGDPPEVLQTVLAYPDHFTDATVIVSMSPFMLNNGLKQGGYYTYAMMAETNPVQLLMEFLPNNPSMLFGYVFDQIRIQVAGRPKPHILRDLAGQPITETRYTAVEKIYNGAVPALGGRWYKDWRVDGPRKDVVEQSLAELRDRVGRLIVIQAPFAPTYQKAVKSSDAVDAGSIREFDATMTAIAARLGITYRSFAFDDIWKDEDFYDATHLNLLGSKRFTEHLVKELLLGN
tara:strand:+ start:23575 stop:24534 length:960 start_codon:yes stop_codon:yes gene_type:complete